MTIEQEKISHVLSGGANSAEFIELISSWMYTDVAMSTEGMYEPTCRRVVFNFPNDFALVIGTGFPLTLIHMTEEVSELTLSTLLPKALSKQWIIRPYANGWTLGKDYTQEIAPDFDEVAEWVELLASFFGEPQLSLPWGDAWYDMPILEGTDFYEFYEEYLEEGELNAWRLLFYVASSIDSGELQEASPWKLEMVESWDMMPFHCDLKRYLRALDAVEAAKLMIIDVDQHCASCAVGVYEDAVKKDPDLEGKYIFSTNGQNTELSFLGDGYIFIEESLPDGAPERELKQFFENEGLPFGLSENPDWQPNGKFEYQSLY